jgi:hypothetical protein
MFELPPEKEAQVARALEWAWLLGLGGLAVLVGFVLLLLHFSPGPLGG